jgi:hypothetical protein
MDRADLRRYLLRDKRDAVSVPQVESLDRQVNA